MQEFTEEFKKIKDTLDRCWGEQGSKKGELNRLQEGRKKVFADIYLGKVSSEKKKIFNTKIKELEEDILDLDIAIEELKHRHMLLKKQGLHIQEVKED